MYVSPLCKTLCLILLFSYTSLYVSSLILNYVNKMNSLSLSFLEFVVCHLCTVSIYLKLYTLIGISLMFVLKIRLYEIIVCSCITNNFFPI